MKISVMSDLHLECYSNTLAVPEVGNGDVLILAGDIINAAHFNNKNYPKHDSVIRHFFNQCSNNYQMTVYVFGNHEHYWSDLSEFSKYPFVKWIENNYSNIFILNRDLVTINKDWAVCGATLWTNFDNENPLAMTAAGRHINDYNYINFSGKKLLPDDILNIHKKDIDWITDIINFNYAENLIVVTHHSPSMRSIHNRYKTSSLNSAYTNNYDHLIMESKFAKYWIHGHTHDKFNYFIGECNVICNPMGYAGLENTLGYTPYTFTI